MLTNLPKARKYTKDISLSCFTSSAVVDVTVQYLLFCCLGEPKINKALTRKQVDSSLGNRANVMCLATNPLPIHYKWTKDGEEVHNSDNVKVHNNILVVTPRQRKDFGVYVCHVSNIAGNATYEIELVQRAKMNISCKYAAFTFTTTACY